MEVDIRFIARMAGVSPATVSRVLSGAKPVSPELRRRVEAEVARYGYRPNRLAQSLISHRSRLIGIVAPSVSGAFHARLISGAEQAADACGYNVMVCNVGDDFAREKRAFEIFAERRVDGILLAQENLPEQLRELTEAVRLPVVAASVNTEGGTLPSVGIDETQAAYDMTSYLLRLGHRRIAGVFNDCYSLGVLRRRGFETALAQSGDGIPAGWRACARCTAQDGARAAEGFFSAMLRPTAVFCVSDEQAAGVMNYLLEHGYRVPEDVSVTGFDDIGLAELLRPRLTTVHQPIEEIGGRSARMLVGLIEGRAEAHPLLLPYSVVIRGSTAEARGL